MRRSESAFLKWFTAQFGKRENGELGDLALVELVKDGKNAERILRERGNWDDNFRAALYAWNARETCGKPRKKEQPKWIDPKAIELAAELLMREADRTDCHCRLHLRIVRMLRGRMVKS